MEKQILLPAAAGFYGAWYPCARRSSTAFLYMLGPTVDSLLVTVGARWLHDMDCHVLALAPEPEKQGHYDYPLEYFGAAIDWLHAQGCRRIGVAGGSATAMMALAAAAYFPDITLTVAMSPCDFVMEGYYRDGLDGVGERPADGHSMLTRNGENLPYLPYANRHPEYWNGMKKEAKSGGNLVASRQMFDRSEQLHPLREEEFIPVENIRGTLLLAGAQDDCLWDTCRYIRRMQDRLTQKGGKCRCVARIYEHGTHFVFPQGMMHKVLPGLTWLPPLIFKAGRRHPVLCTRSRVDFDRQIRQEILLWKNS